jgi:hypothetical protein
MIESDEYIRILKIISEECSMTELLQINQYISRELIKRIQFYVPVQVEYISNEFAKLKVFMRIFDRMLKFPKNTDNQAILETDLINHLTFDGGLSIEECKQHIKKAMINGLIYEKRAGYYAKP